MSMTCVRDLVPHCKVTKETLSPNGTPLLVFSVPTDLVPTRPLSICDYIMTNCPSAFKPLDWFNETGFSGEKTSSAQSYVVTRGKAVTAEVLIPAEVCDPGAQQ